MPLIMGEMFSGLLQDAAIYTVWAKDCLQTSTSMNGPPSVVSRQSIKEEILEMEGLCRVQWDIQQTGYGPGSSFDGECCRQIIVTVCLSTERWLMTIIFHVLERQTALYNVGELLKGMERAEHGSP